MGIQTTLGTTYAISASEPATETESGYGDLTYTEVGEISNFDGTLGPTFNDVTHTPVATGITQHRKGGSDYGSFSMTLADDADDAGQDLIESGVDGVNQNAVYSHRITLPDGTKKYFTGQFFSFPLSIGNSDAMVTRTVDIKVSSKVVTGASS